MKQKLQIALIHFVYSLSLTGAVFSAIMSGFRSMKGYISASVSSRLTERDDFIETVKTGKSRKQRLYEAHERAVQSIEDTDPS